MIVSKYKKQTILLYASSIVGMLLGVLVSILNTHFLSPIEYGDLRYVQNIINFVSSLLLIGYFTSGSRLLAISDDDNEKRQIRGVMCVILSFTIIIVMLSMGVLAMYSEIVDKHNLTILFLISIPVCGNVLMLNYINTTAQGDNHILHISIARLVPSLLYCSIAFFIYIFCGATPALMLLLYNGLAIIVLFYVILSTKPSFKNLKETYKVLRVENNSYGFNVYIGSLVAVSTQYIAGITLGVFCENNANVGFYTLALSLSAPMAMLPGVIGTTHFRKFSRVNRIDRRIIIASIGITILTLALFLLFIKYIVGFLYDDNYSSVSLFASILAFGTCFYGLGDLFNRFLGSHGRGREIRNSAIACGVITIIGYWVLVYFFDIYGAIVTRIVGALVYFLCMIYYYVKFTRIQN